MSENKPINYYLRAQKMNIGKHAGKKMYYAQPIARERYSFRQFCKMVAEGSTFTEEEVSALINRSVKIARFVVANGDSVEFGDLGTLTPTFRTRAVEKAEEFNASVNIFKPRVRLIANAKYFAIPDATYLRTAKDATGNKKTKPEKDKLPDTDSPKPPSPTDGNSDSGL